MSNATSSVDAPSYLDRLLTLDHVKATLGCGTTKLYEVLPDLDVRKVGRRTVVTEASLRQYIANLPKATLGRRTAA